MGQSSSNIEAESAGRFSTVRASSRSLPDGHKRRIDRTVTRCDYPSFDALVGRGLPRNPDWWVKDSAPYHCPPGAKSSTGARSLDLNNTNYHNRHCREKNTTGNIPKSSWSDVASDVCRTKPVRHRTLQQHHHDELKSYEELEDCSLSGSQQNRPFSQASSKRDSGRRSHNKHCEVKQFREVTYDDKRSAKPLKSSKSDYGIRESCYNNGRVPVRAKSEDRNNGGHGHVKVVASSHTSSEKYGANSGQRKPNMPTEFREAFIDGPVVNGLGPLRESVSGELTHSHPSIDYNSNPLCLSTSAKNLKSAHTDPNRNDTDKSPGSFECAKLVIQSLKAELDSERSLRVAAEARVIDQSERLEILSSGVSSKNDGSKELSKRVQELETERENLIRENKEQRMAYDKMLDDIANRVAKALMHQKSLKSERQRLQKRIVEVEWENKLLKAKLRLNGTSKSSIAEAASACYATTVIQRKTRNAIRDPKYRQSMGSDPTLKHSAENSRSTESLLSITSITDSGLDGAQVEQMVKLRSSFLNSREGLYSRPESLSFDVSEYFSSPVSAVGAEQSPMSINRCLRQYKLGAPVVDSTGLIPLHQGSSGTYFAVAKPKVESASPDKKKDVKVLVKAGFSSADAKPELSDNSSEQHFFNNNGDDELCNFASEETESPSAAVDYGSFRRSTNANVTKSQTTTSTRAESSGIEKGPPESSGQEPLVPLAATTMTDAEDFTCRNVNGGLKNTTESAREVIVGLVLCESHNSFGANSKSASLTRKPKFLDSCQYSANSFPGSTSLPWEKLQQLQQYNNSDLSYVKDEGYSTLSNDYFECVQLQQAPAENSHVKDFPARSCRLSTVHLRQRCYSDSQLFLLPSTKLDRKFRQNTVSDTDSGISESLTSRRASSESSINRCTKLPEELPGSFDSKFMDAFKHCDVAETFDLPELNRIYEDIDELNLRESLFAMLETEAMTEVGTDSAVHSVERTNDDITRTSRGKTPSKNASRKASLKSPSNAGSYCTSSSFSEDSDGDALKMIQDWMRQLKIKEKDCSDKSVVRYNPPAVRPSVLRRDAFKRFGEPERSALAAFDFLGLFPSPSPAQSDSSDVATVHRRSGRNCLRKQKTSAQLVLNERMQAKRRSRSLTTLQHSSSADVVAFTGEGGESIYENLPYHLHTASAFARSQTDVNSSSNKNMPNNENMISKRLLSGNNAAVSLRGNNLNPCSSSVSSLNSNDDDSSYCSSLFLSDLCGTTDHTSFSSGSSLSFHVA